MKNVLLVLLLFTIACSSEGDESKYVTELEPIEVNISDYEALDFVKNPAVGIIQKWRINDKGFFFLYPEGIYYFENPNSKPILINSDKILELQSCQIDDFAVEGDNLYLLCQGKGQLVEINLDSMTFSSIYDLGIDASRVEVLGSQVFLYQTSNTLNSDPSLNYELHSFKLNSPDKRVKFFAYESFDRGLNSVNVFTNESFTKYEDRIVFSRLLSDSLHFFGTQGELLDTEIISVISQKQEESSTLEIDPERVYYPLYLTANSSALLYSLIKDGDLLTTLESRLDGSKTVFRSLSLGAGDVRMPLIGQIFEDDVYLLLTDEALLEFNSEKLSTEPFISLQNYEKSFVLIRVSLGDLLTK